MKTLLRIIPVQCLFFLLLFPQQHRSSVITGVVVSSSNGRPLEFVSVAVLRLRDSSIASGTVTKKNGSFEIASVPDGEYSIRYSILGFKEKHSAHFHLDSSHTEINLGKTSLEETEVRLSEVTVTSDKSELNTTIDRKVYNVQQDVMSKTGSASDLLQNIPSVQVDLDGNVSLRGSANVMILINGKNSPLMGKTRAEVLQQLPANAIEKIEVITNPSAKYKPDGTSGIINIVMKKETGTGLNGSVGGNIGNRDRSNANVSLNYHPGSVNVFGNYSYRQDDRNQSSSDLRSELDSSVNTFNHYSDHTVTLARPHSHIAAAGIDVTIDESNSAGISGNYHYRGFIRTESSAKLFNDNTGALIQDYHRNRFDDEFEKEMGGTAYLQHNFRGEDENIRIEYTLSHSPEIEDNKYTNLFRIPAIAVQYDNTIIKQTDDQKQLTVEYKNEFEDHSTFEAGYAGDFNDRDMDYFGEAFDTLQHTFLTDSEKTNHFIYNETIHAFYATVEHSYGLFSLLGGLRTEASIIKANLISKNITISNNYVTLYPTLHLAYKYSDGAEVQLNYSRRANRPEGDDLNPFPEYRDPRNLRAGNPRLKPELIHSVEFGVQWQNDQFTIVPSIFYRDKYNGFTSVIQKLNDSTLLTTKTNLASEQSKGVELVMSGSISKIFSTNISANVFSEEIDASNLGFSTRKSTVTWSSTLSGNLSLPTSTIVQMNSNYRSSRLTPQGEIPAAYVVNLGIRQELFNDQLSIIFTVSDIFKTLNRKMTINTSWLNETMVTVRDSRIMYLGFTYHFGTQAKKKSEEKSLQYDNGL